MSTSEHAPAHVDQRRVRRDIERTAEFGAVDHEEGRGRTALPATDANGRAREYLVDRLTEAGLDVRIDAVGNIAGRWVPDGVDPDRPAVAAGSHLDSVPEGGIFDGVLGVYAALEAVRAMQRAGSRLDRPVEVVCFTEEEGTRFSDGVLGSSVAVGERTVDDALALTDDEGTTLEESLAAIGFQGEGRLDATGWDAWLELHVEQGGRLEGTGTPVGIVTGITGMTRCEVEIVGETDHAGTTSMSTRTDALAAASEVVLEVESASRDLAGGESETAVGTVGRLDIEPNAVNVIPGRVVLSLDVRDVATESIETVVGAVRDRLARLERERGVAADIDRPYDIDPVPMSDRCVDALQDAADGLGIETRRLHSGAGHDTMHVATVTDAGMVFAPSRGGVSHSPREWTDWSDCAAATRLLTAGLVTLASE